MNGNDGNDVINIQTISGPTTVNGGNGSDTFNVGSEAPATARNGIAALLTINGNAPTSGSDCSTWTTPATRPTTPAR